MRSQGVRILDSNILKDTFLSCRTYLVRVASRIVPPDEVEDIVQETYVRACQLSVREEIKEPRAFIAKIARNLALDHIKRAEWRLSSRLDETPEAELLWAGGSDDPLRRVVSNEEFGLFCEAVRLLPQQCRRVFVLRKVYGYSQKEIARILSISENTIEKHIAKGMAHCIRSMKSDDHSPRNASRDEHVAHRGKTKDDR